MFDEWNDRDVGFIFGYDAIQNLVKIADSIGKNEWDRIERFLPARLKLIRGRCNHENKIEQLDNGVHALKMPAAEFMANWAYMAICTLAWNLKSWLGLMIKDDEKRTMLISCAFKRFQNMLINIPCQILVTGRKLVYRFLNYNSWVKIIFGLWGEIKCLRFSSA